MTCNVSIFFQLFSGIKSKNTNTESKNIRSIAFFSVKIQNWFKVLLNIKCINTDLSINIKYVVYYNHFEKSARKVMALYLSVHKYYVVNIYEYRRKKFTQIICEVWCSNVYNAIANICENSNVTSICMFCMHTFHIFILIAWLHELQCVVIYK